MDLFEKTFGTRKCSGTFDTKIAPIYMQFDNVVFKFGSLFIIVLHLGQT